MDSKFLMKLDEYDKKGHLDHWGISTRTKYVKIRSIQQLLDKLIRLQFRTKNPSSPQFRPIWLHRHSQTIYAEVRVDGFRIQLRPYRGSSNPNEYLYIKDIWATEFGNDLSYKGTKIIL